jgi:pyrroline-5-carboxylate reductase
MSKRRLMVVGGGQMGRALVGGMLASEVLDRDQIQLVDPDSQCRSWWTETHPGISVTDTLSAAVTGADTVLLAVKPNIMPVVAKQRGKFWNGKLVISIAAGISLDQLAGWIGHKRIVRVMPNTPCLVGAGASAYCAAADVTDEDVDQIESMLRSVGFAIRVDEKQIDAVTGLSGSGPAYVCMVIESLADGGVLAGLPRTIAMELAVQTVLGTARMVAETGQHPAALKDAVASPGGTTIAAIASLEQNGLRSALIQAVAASAGRSRQLGGEA